MVKFVIMLAVVLNTGFVKRDVKPQTKYDDQIMIKIHNLLGKPVGNIEHDSTEQ